MRALALLGVALAIAFTARAHAATFVEIGDAGQSLATASAVDVMTLEAIAGTIETEDDADLFALHLTAGVPFVAVSSSVGGISDTQLFLFDAAGRGLAYNDDIEATDFLSRIGFTPSARGLYYLGISGAGFNPQDAAIPPSFIYASDPFDPTAQPGASAAGPLASWAGVEGAFRDSGAYRIELTGAAPVPEPGAFAFLAVGVGALAFLRRRLASRN